LQSVTKTSWRHDSITLFSLESPQVNTCYKDKWPKKRTYKFFSKTKWQFQGTYVTAEQLLHSFLSYTHQLWCHSEIGNHSVLFMHWTHCSCL